MSKLDFSSQAEEYTPQQAVRDSAARLRLAPDDLATAIAYETGGTFDPWQQGPVTKWGEHRGLIQWGEPQRQQYGVTPDMPFQEQVQRAEQYFLDRGFKPGEHGLRDLYSTINAGGPGRYTASDRPGFDVNRHVQEMEGYRGRAQAFLNNDQQIIEPATQMAQYEPVPGGMDFSSQAEPAQQSAPVTPQTYEPIPGGMDFSSHAEEVVPGGLPRSLGQQEPLPVGEAGGEAPAGEVGRPPPAVPADASGEAEGGAFDWFWRSKYRWDTKNLMLKVLNERVDIPTAAQEFKRLVDLQEAVPERQAYTEGAKAMARYEKGLAPEYEGPKGWFKFFLDHPSYALESIAESGFQTGEGVIVGGAGAIVGAPLGPAGMAAGLALGVGASSGVTEGIGKYMEALQEEGIDVTSEESLAGAFANPELLSKVRTKAIAKGLTVGFFDGFTAMLGARGVGRPIAESIAKVVGSDAAKKGAARKNLEEATAELFFLEAPGGMAGEAFGELASEGEIANPISVMMEGFGEIALGGPQVAIQTAIAQEGRETSAADAERIKQVTSTITQVPAYEEAVAEGRNWFGFVEGNYGPDASPGETRVFTNYSTAEEAMGRMDPRKGKLVAVGENEITATFTDASAQGATATPRFVSPETEPQARQAWEDFIKSGRPTDYKRAVREGLRITPARESGEFVGDMSAAEILPKSETPIRSDMYMVKVQDPTTGKEKEITGRPGGLNLHTLLSDTDFVVHPTQSAFVSMKDNPQAPQRAATLFEVTDAQLQAGIQAQGWGSFINEMANLSNSEIATLFRNGNVKLRPSLAWNARIPSYSGEIVVSSKLDETATKAALQKHKTTLPDSGISGVPTTEQVPRIGNVTSHASFHLEETTPSAPGKVAVYFGSVVDPEHEQLVNAWAGIAERMMKTFGIKNRLIVTAVAPSDFTSLRGRFTSSEWQAVVNATQSPKRGHMAPLKNGDVWLFLPPGRTSVERTRTWAHEFGHALAYWALTGLDAKHQAQIYAAYRRYVLTYRHGQDVRHYAFRGMAHPAAGEILSGDHANYFKTFEEWFAEQTARWGTTSVKPIGHLAKFFRALAKRIITAFKAFQQQNPYAGSMKAEPVIQEWLDAVYTGNANFSIGVRQTLVDITRAENMKHGVDIPLQAESVKTSQVLNNMPVSAPPNAGTPGNHTLGARRAQNDRFNWVMKWFTAYHQVAQENMHIPEVQFYTEGMRMSRLDVNNIMAEAETILKQAVRPLRGQKTAGKTQADRLGDFLFDMTEMNYRTTDEVNKNIRRNPTAAELQALITKHKLSPEAIAAFEQIREFFVKAVLRGEEVAIMEARHTFANNPAQQQVAIATAQMMTRRLLNAPYFPMTRFGEWAVTIRTQAGGVERFETFESRREQQQAFAEAKRQYPESQGWSVRASVLPDDVKSFAGMPPWFLDRLQQLPGMTEQQRQWMQLLRYQVSPARSFRKHLLPRKKTAGFSRDLERVFARYAFQHARNYGRIKYQRFLEAQIKALRGEVFQPGHGDVNERSRMANFLKDHFDNVMDPKSDWHMLRSVTSVWYLGFVPSSAALNMTQSLIMTAPFLGSKFGDAKAMKAMTKAAGQISTFYKRGTYEGQTAGHMKMLDFLIKRGDVTESMAAELAGLAAGNALDSYFGFGEKAHRSWLAFADKAMLMFKMVEQWNRRVAARATFDLAMADPNNEYVQNMKVKYFLQYQRMLQEGFGTETEIVATLAAGDSILSTHYDYSKEARPRFMRGKAGLLFAFYMFTQNTVFQLSSRENKGLFIRYALIMTLLAGPMGLLPEDGEDILNFIGKKFFGKDFNLSLEARKLVNDLTNDERMTDGILHGTGRYSFGIPALMEAVGGPSVPEIDFSRLVELRHIAPLPVTKGLDVLSRGVDTEKQISRWAQDLAGAGFGLPFAWAMALGDTELDWGDPKRWEKAVPRAMGKVLQSWRRYRDEGVRINRSNIVLEYDTSDPQDVAEIVAYGLGFTPTREALNWDESSAKREVATFWKSKRQALLARAYEAKLGKWKNQDMWQEAKRAIQDFNKETPDPTLRISSDTIQKSFKARMRTHKEFLEGDGPNMPPIIGRDIGREFPDTKRVGEQRVPLGTGQ